MSTTAIFFWRTSEPLKASKTTTWHASRSGESSICCVFKNRPTFKSSGTCTWNTVLLSKGFTVEISMRQGLWAQGPASSRCKQLPQITTKLQELPVERFFPVPSLLPQVSLHYGLGWLILLSVYMHTQEPWCAQGKCPPGQSTCQRIPSKWGWEFIHSIALSLFSFSLFHFFLSLSFFK